MVSALRVAARSMSDFDDDLQLDNWLNLTLSQPHDPVACREMLMRAANGDTFAISDRPEITFPWRRTIASRTAARREQELLEAADRFGRHGPRRAGAWDTHGADRRRGCHGEKPDG
eukprot:scaffold4171_cov126-Isochrysis_galbana.AAC.2